MSLLLLLILLLSSLSLLSLLSLFFFNDTATTEIYTLSLHDALPIEADYRPLHAVLMPSPVAAAPVPASRTSDRLARRRSEEHTSELQSHSDLVCRLLLEKKKKKREKLIHRQQHESTQHKNTSRLKK